jgi:PAS domain S-box-containing protein
LGCPIDITERKRSEQFEKRFASVVESSDDAIVSKDLDGIIKTWNAGAERLFGYTAEEVIGKPITLLIPVDRHGEESDILSRIQRGERIDHYETVRQRKDGSLVEISSMFAGALTRGSIGTIPASEETTNTQRFEEDSWLSDLDSNQD